MKKYRCKSCGYITDEEIKEDFLCPLCGVNKEYFEEIIVLDEEEKPKSIPIDEDNPSIQRIVKRCINCGRCKTICENIVGIKYDREKCKNNICIGCGQCILNCPVGALVTKYNYKAVEQAINDDSKVVVCITAPAVRTSLGESFGMEPGTLVEKIMVSSLKEIGFDYVFDVTFGADLTVMEEATELIDRIQNNKRLPMFTSCCPSWVKYARVFTPFLLDNLSTTKSPISIQSTIIKKYFSKLKGIDESDIIVVALTPCTSKKLERTISGLDTTDFVITASEYSIWLKERGIDFNKLQDKEFDSLFGRGSGAGIIFGASGGVCEGIVRTMYYMLTNKTPSKRLLEFTEIRGLKKAKEATVIINGIKINVLVVQSLPALSNIIDEVKEENSKYHLIEVMNCIGGCIGGGGEPLSIISKQDEVRIKRCKTLYECDKDTKIKSSYENPDIKRIYKEFIGKPSNEKAQELLHIEYKDESDLLK